MKITPTEDPQGQSHETYEVQSASGNTYTVRYEGLSGTYDDDPEYDTGYWSCTCPAFQYHPDRDCKHIKSVIARTNDEAA